MLSVDDHPGIFYFMVGIIVLVMAGVGLSVVMDRKQGSMSGTAGMRNEIAANSAEISHLQNRLEDRAGLLEKRGRVRSEQSTALNGIEGTLSTLKQRRLELKESRDQLVKSLPALDEAFANHRAAYRRNVWETAINERVGTLNVRGGREYRDVEIARVTEVGIEIRHKDGIARIQAPDLGDEWQDRFQWNDEERRSRLKEELEAHRRMVEMAGANDTPVARLQQRRPIPVRNQAPSSETDPELLAELRAQVMGWQNRVNRISLERNSAMSQASYGSANSVSGSLETWKAKSARLGGELVHANTQLVLAKSRLAAVAPNDPLLRDPQQGTIQR